MLITEMAFNVQDYNMDEEEDSQASQWYGVREATLFLVDATQKMFEVESETKLSHIQKFFKVSYNIILHIILVNELHINK